MDKYLHSLQCVEWNYLSIPKLQQLYRWSLEMDKQFHPTVYNGYNYLSMLGLKLNHVSKRGHWWLFYSGLNRHQTILHTFLNFFLNLTLSGVPHLYKQLPNGQYLSDLCKMCNLEANLWKIWIGDHRILTYIFKWERLNTAGQSRPVSISHWVAPLYKD